MFQETGRTLPWSSLLSIARGTSVVLHPSSTAQADGWTVASWFVKDQGFLKVSSSTCGLWTLLKFDKSPRLSPWGFFFFMLHLFSLLGDVQAPKPLAQGEACPEAQSRVTVVKLKDLNTMEDVWLEVWLTLRRTVFCELQRCKMHKSPNCSWSQAVEKTKRLIASKNSVQR